MNKNREFFINNRAGIVSPISFKQSEAITINAEGDVTEYLAISTPSGVWTGVESSYIYRPMIWQELSDVIPVLRYNEPTLSSKVGLWAIGFGPLARRDQKN